MTESKSDGRRWLRFRCLGTLAGVGLVVVWLGVIVGMAFFAGRRETVGSRELSRDLPEERVDRESVADAATSASRGRIILKFEVGEFFVEPGLPGEPVRIEAEFDTRSYELRDSFEPGDGSGWVYRVTFRQSGWLRDNGLRTAFGAHFPRIRVLLPPDVPIALEGSFRMGHAGVELGGLWLTEADLWFEKGGADLSVARPLVVPLDRFRIRGKQGGVSTVTLGNASPRRLLVDHRMGGMEVDLRGAWVRDAEVTVVNLMGGSDVRLPDNVNLEGVGGGGSPTPPSDPEIPVPTIRMRPTSHMGGMDILE